MLTSEVPATNVPSTLTLQPKRRSAFASPLASRTMECTLTLIVRRPDVSVIHAVSTSYSAMLPLHVNQSEPVNIVF